MKYSSPLILAVVLSGTVSMGGALPARAGNAPSCDEIIAKYEMSNPQISPEELAKQMNVSVEHVRKCMETKAANPSDAPGASTGGKPKK